MLPRLDLNQNQLIQSQSCYRYTTGQTVGRLRRRGGTIATDSQVAKSAAIDQFGLRNRLAQMLYLPAAFWSRRFTVDREMQAEERSICIKCGAFLLTQF